MKNNFFGVELQSRELNLVLSKNYDDCRTGAVSNKAVFIKYCPDFKVFSRNHAKNVKYHFPSNVLRGWRFQ